MNKRYHNLDDLPIGTHVTVHNSDFYPTPFNGTIQISQDSLVYGNNSRAINPDVGIMLSHHTFTQYNQHLLEPNEYATILIDPSINNLPNDLFEV